MKGYSVYVLFDAKWSAYIYMYVWLHVSGTTSSMNTHTQKKRGINGS